jgi:hypothetical protein
VLEDGYNGGPIAVLAPPPTRGPRKQAIPLSAHLNEPLRLPSPWKSDKIWTKKALDTEREEFFHVMSSTNEAIMWQAIHGICQILWDGGDAKDEDEGLATAQVSLRRLGTTLSDVFFYIRCTANSISRPS